MNEMVGLLLSLFFFQNNAFIFYFLFNEVKLVRNDIFSWYTKVLMKKRC